MQWRRLFSRERCGYDPELLAAASSRGRAGALGKKTRTSRWQRRRIRIVDGHFETQPHAQPAYRGRRECLTDGKGQGRRLNYGR